MEHHCRNCRETRFFRLKQEGTEYDVYECSYCSTEWKRMTGTGFAITAAKIASAGLLGFFLGGHHDGSSTS